MPSEVISSHADNEGARELRWEVRLWRTAPEKRWAIVAVACVAFMMGLALLHSAVLGALGAIVIAASTTEMFLPLKYRLDAKGATVRNGISVSAIEWESVKRVIPMDNGVKLSPLQVPGRLDPFRGVYLRFAGNDEEVLAKIRQFCGSDAELLAKRTD